MPPLQLVEEESSDYETADDGNGVTNEEWKTAEKQASSIDMDEAMAWYESTYMLSAFGAQIPRNMYPSVQHNTATPKKCDSRRTIPRPIVATVHVNGHSC